MLVYDEQNVGKRAYVSIIPYHEQNAVANWARHYANSLMLTFFLNNGTTAEKLQAQKEFVVCERKMKFWEHHANFDKNEAVKVAESTKKKWRAR